MDAELTAELLRDRIRRALNVGKLPLLAGLTVSGGCGDATCCACCETDIPNGQIRLTLLGSAVGTRLNLRVAMHPQCAQFWFDEAEKRQLSLVGAP
ncbi:MAG: hypothetical protein JSR66_17175 [Proteobacteria bacterium]|nr:hypothetical protein [Pseudomonadota bacterium]